MSSMLDMVETFCKADPSNFVCHGDCVEVNNGDSWETYSIEDFYEEYVL
jgi:hypothetical protein